MIVIHFLWSKTKVSKSKKYFKQMYTEHTYVHAFDF